MVYSSRFVLKILLNGNVIEDRHDGVVAIPFGSEYAIRCRNRHKDRRALVKVFIDKENISGEGFVLEADGCLDLKRRLDVDAALKLVELTSDEARETGKEDNTDGSKGVIEAHFYLEKKPRKVKPLTVPIVMPVPYPAPPVGSYDPYPWPWKQPHNPVWRTQTVTVGCSVGETSLLSPTNTPKPVAPRILEEGCTVDGGYTGQQFVPVAFEAEKEFVSMKLVLRGFKPGPDDKLGVTSIGPRSDVAFCTNCGQKKGRKADKFCGKCGTRF